MSIQKTSKVGNDRNEHMRESNIVWKYQKWLDVQKDKLLEDGSYY